LLFITHLHGFSYQWRLGWWQIHRQRLLAAPELRSDIRGSAFVVKITARNSCQKASPVARTPGRYRSANDTRLAILLLAAISIKEFISRNTVPNRPDERRQWTWWFCQHGKPFAQTLWLLWRWPHPCCGSIRRGWHRGSAAILAMRPTAIPFNRRRKVFSRPIGVRSRLSHQKPSPKGSPTERLIEPVRIRFGMADTDHLLAMSTTTRRTHDHT